MEKVSRKLNGMLKIPLNTTNLVGGIQQVITLIECFQEHSRAQDIQSAFLMFFQCPFLERHL
jgi:hypothetical protein